jgi:hypothetical protein
MRESLRSRPQCGGRSVPTPAKSRFNPSVSRACWRDGGTMAHGGQVAGLSDREPRPVRKGWGLDRGAGRYLPAWAAALLVGAVLLSAHPAGGFDPSSWSLPPANCPFFVPGRLVFCRLGLELWVEGRKGEDLFEQWDLSCRSLARQQPDCFLWRTDFYPRGSVSIREYSTRDGSLTLWRLDWAEGVISFDFADIPHNPQAGRFSVVMRLKPSVGGLMRDVEAFQAKATERLAVPGVAEEVLSVEFRLPEYSYVKNVPILILGRKSRSEEARQKFYDDLKARLSAADWQVASVAMARCWEQLEGEIQRPYAEKRKLLERKVAEAMKSGSKALAEASEALNRFSLEADKQMERSLQSRLPALQSQFEQCLAGAGMSKRGSALAASSVFNLLARD